MDSPGVGGWGGGSSQGTRTKRSCRPAVDEPHSAVITSLNTLLGRRCLSYLFCNFQYLFPWYLKLHFEIIMLLTMSVLMLSLIIA